MVDPVYGSPLVSQLVSKILLDGKKTMAQSIVYSALEGTYAKAGQDLVQTLRWVLNNVGLSIEAKFRCAGGVTYQAPIEVKPKRRATLAVCWFVSFSHARREKTVTERFVNEILDASNGLGVSVKCREDTHKVVEVNRVFTHYRW